MIPLRVIMGQVFAESYPERFLTKEDFAIQTFLWTLHNACAIC
jgi:hypothetical protein